jgi:hypothetical protein
MATRTEKIEALIAGWTRDADHGIRIVDEPVAVGTELPRSFRWDDGEWTDEELVGTCAIDLTRRDATRLASHYFGRYALLVGGVVALYGEDDGEVIMRDAVCEACVEIGE